MDEFQDEVLSKPPGSGLKPEVKSTEAVPEADSAYKAQEKTPGNDSDELDLDEFQDMFASKLSMGIDNLLQGLDDSPESMKQFETLLKDFAKMGDTTAATPKAPNASSTASTSGKEKKSFQDTISETMNRLNESKQEIDKSVLEGDDSDFLAKMMKDIGAGGDDLDLPKLINEMLQQMASKEILYEPMKEMYDKYPTWLRDNDSKITDEEKTRYQQQYKIISEVVLKFESPTYSDDNDDDRKYITQRMEDMQNSGTPPQDLLGDLTSGSIPGFDVDNGGMPKDLEGCTTQ